MSNKKNRKTNLNKNIGGAAEVVTPELKKKREQIVPILERLIKYYTAKASLIDPKSPEFITYSQILVRYKTLLKNSQTLQLNDLNFFITQLQMDSIKINLDNWKSSFDTILEKNKNCTNDLNNQATEIKNSMEAVTQISSYLKSMSGGKKGTKMSKGGDSSKSTSTSSTSPMKSSEMGTQTAIKEDVLNDKFLASQKNNNVKYAQINREVAQKMKPFYNNFLDTLDNFSDLIINKNNLNETNKDLVRKLIEKLEEKTTVIAEKDNIIKQQNEYMRQYGEFFDVLDDFNQRAVKTIERINKIMDEYGRTSSYVTEFVTSIK